MPKIARAVGLSNSQSLHHFSKDSTWSSQALRQRRLQLILQLIEEAEIVVCVDQTVEKKSRSKAMDYVAQHYIGNLGKTERGIVSVNAYGIIGTITCPLLFKILKPKGCLKLGNTDKTKTELAREIICELNALRFKIKLVLADSLCGESSSVISTLKALNLNFIVGIRSHYSVLVGPRERVRYNRWKAYQQQLSHRQKEHA